MLRLTRDEAVERSRLLIVEDYRIELDFRAAAESATPRADTFVSRTEVRFSCREPGASSFIEIDADRVLRAELNGRRLVDADGDGDGDGRIRLPELAATNHLFVDAELAFSHTGEGAHRFLDPADGETYVGIYCGVDVAHQVFACFDQPDLKARLGLRVQAPAPWTVVANGAVHSVSEGRWEFAPTPPIPPYLFAAFAGPLHTVHSTHRGIDFDLHCRRSLQAELDRDAEEILAVSRACFDRYAELFDEPYAFDKYAQVFVPGLNWGALENPGCITFRDELLFTSAVTSAERQSRAVVIAHEMAHMWFGNLVTMRWWDDTWLSESFAEFMGYDVTSTATQFSGGWTDFVVGRRQRGFDADQRPSTHPIAPLPEDVLDTEAALANFDGISYDKGAAVLRQLREWVGPEAFLRGVNSFISRHRFRSAEQSDLIDDLSRASGRDVHAWGAAWLSTTGVDTVEVERVRGAVVARRLGDRPHHFAVAAFGPLSGDGSALTRTGQVELDIDSALIPVPFRGQPGLVVPDPEGVGFCKVRLDESSLEVVRRSLRGIAEPVTRAVLWSSLRDLVRDGELSPTAYLALVVDHLPAETDVFIVGSVLGFARSVICDRYVAKTARPDALRVLAAVAAQLAQAPDEGIRLTGLRTWIESLDAGAARLELPRWVDEGRAPTGASLDENLRWRVLLRLCVLDVASPSDIDRQLARDPGSTGHEQAATCRAAVPSSEAKAAAWVQLFGAAGEPPSARMFSATARGFWWPEQNELLDPYIALYFPAAVEIARRRGQTIAAAAGNLAFPRFATDPGVVVATERCLAVGNPAPILRRALVDQLDDLRRALRVRAQG
ncbi:MAG: aminopeptidase N [Actinobacteria bacterium]|nr:aminopeptidase N [Actinomycetota bacterium]